MQSDCSGDDMDIENSVETGIDNIVDIKLPALSGFHGTGASPSPSNTNGDSTDIISMDNGSAMAKTSRVVTAGTGTCGGLHGFVDIVTPKYQEDLDVLWAEAVYSNMWSFNSTQNPILLDFFRKLRPGYRPPTAYQLSNRLLSKTVTKVEGLISDAINKSVAVTIKLDGWSDINRESIVNVALHAGRPIFLKSINPGIQRHDAHFICDTIINVVESQDPGQHHKFKAVITDQPSVMTAA